MLMKTYKSSSQLKAEAKDLLQGNYLNAVLIFVASGVFTSLITSCLTWFIPTNTPWGMCLNIMVTFGISILTGMFQFGITFFFLKLCCGQPHGVGDIFYAFKSQPKKVMTIQLVLSFISALYTVPMYLFTTLFMQTNRMIWMSAYFLTLALCIPLMIFLNLFVSQAYYLLLDFPALSAKEALLESCKIMKGHKGRLFYLNISFIPLTLLGFLACGVGAFFVMAYQSTALALFFLDLMNHRNTSEV